MKKYIIITYGCQMNKSDSERIAAVLKKAGFWPTENIKEANLAIVNSCSVRQSAVDRVWGKINQLKIKNPKLKTVLTGCILSIDKKKAKDKFDLVLDIREIKLLKNIIEGNECGERWNNLVQNSLFNSVGIKMTKNSKYDYLKIGPFYSTNYSALIPIMTGCNNFCSYCVVPYTRGREYSRPTKEIIKEIKKLLEKDYKEIILLGQNVNSYKDGEINFPKLLRMINNLPGKFWLRFLTSHPKDMNDELIKTMANCKKVTPYIHLPVQSGNNQILKKMNRHYTTVHYKNLIKKIRNTFITIRKGFEDMHPSITTDIIVGFPNETKKQFQDTAKLMQEVKFDMAYITRYSPRAGTTAARFDDTILLSEKKRREKILNEILKKTAFEKNKKYIGRTIEVLIEKVKDGFIIGKTKTFKTVKILANNLKPGDLIDANIINATPWGLQGKIMNNESKIKHHRKKLIVILGPTASGKSDLAVWLAKKINGEVISADSRQVYRNMNIGSGKITKKEMQSIPHYLLDVASPKKRFTVAQYKKLAEKAIKKIYYRNKIPIICGGTGFYIQAVANGINIPEVKPDAKLRVKLEKKTTKDLFNQLEKLDPSRAKNIDKNNRRRLIRALEIVLKTGKPIPILKTKQKYNVLMIGLAPSKNKLKSLIKKRLIKRLKQGMTKEVKNLKKSGLSWKKLEEFGLEYRYVALYLQNKISHKEMIDSIQKESEHYAKRQITWFRKDKRIHWIKDRINALRLAKEFLR